MVLITPLEVNRAAEYLEMEYGEFINTFTDQGGKKFFLKDVDDACIFFENNACQIYDVRPTQCRTFPFWPSNLKSKYRWKTVSEKCEGIGQGKRYSIDEINVIKGEEGETRPGPTPIQTMDQTISPEE